MRNKKSSINLLNSIEARAPKRNKFDLSHDIKTTFNMGQLVPVLQLNCVPGDTVFLRAQSLIRFAPLVSPVMHRMDCRIEYFFVPYRILWENFEKFITGEDPALVHPYVSYGAGSYDAFRLFNYLQLPRPASNSFDINAFPFAAYQCIWNEYYRDQNLQEQVEWKLTDGANNSNSDLPVLRNRCWGHDRFTSALPFAQKGTAVDVPLGEVTGGDVFVNKSNTGVDVTGTPVGGGTGFIAIQSSPDADIDPDHLYVKGQTVTPTTINDLRLAYALQRFKELDARAGTRYIELLRGFFGVKSSDARLQRPEYVVGVKTPVMISEVLNTTGQITLDEENPGLPQGNMAGHGVSVIDGSVGMYRVEEHGIIMGLVSVLPLTSYQQGIPKEFLFNDRYDYYWPQFDHLGEDVIQNVEVDADHSLPYDTFGYTPRYSYMKFMNSVTTGDFKTSLNQWTLTRIFETPPNLNANFVEANPSKRIFAVTDENVDSLYCQIVHNLECIRPMSLYSTPI